VALIGTLGACAAPLVVVTTGPAPWPLFLFLAALAPTLVALARLTGWTWLLWLHLAGMVGRRRPRAAGHRPSRRQLGAGQGIAVDLGELTGLYRAASFLALGLSLIAVGWLYRRFVAAA
jgi:uncharacterized membrane protein